MSTASRSGRAPGIAQNAQLQIVPHKRNDLGTGTGTGTGASTGTGMAPWRNETRSAWLERPAFMTWTATTTPATIGGRS